MKSKSPQPNREKQIKVKVYGKYWVSNEIAFYEKYGWKTLIVRPTKWWESNFGMYEYIIEFTKPYDPSETRR